MPVGIVGGRPDRQQSQTPFIRRASLYLGVALELPAEILGGLLIGYLLDNYFGTSPWLLIAVTFVAFVGAFVRLVHWINNFSKEQDGSRGKKSDTTY
jgi:F0F1-type ATP synthase assembly protein I